MATTYYQPYMSLLRVCGLSNKTHKSNRTYRIYFNSVSIKLFYKMFCSPQGDAPALFHALQGETCVFISLFCRFKLVPQYYICFLYFSVSFLKYMTEDLPPPIVDSPSPPRAGGNQPTMKIHFMMVCILISTRKDTTYENSCFLSER